MRILKRFRAAALDIPSVQAEAGASTIMQVTLSARRESKQVGQLYREWYAIVDVMDVRAGAPLQTA